MPQSASTLNIMKRPEKRQAKFRIVAMLSAILFN